MKHGKKPTRKQMDFIKRKGLNPDNWLVVKDTTEKMVLRHRHFDKNIRVVHKAVREKEELKPCPFCGAKESDEDQPIGAGWVIEEDAWQVFCERCGASGGLHDGRAEAITAWNRR